MNLPKTRKLMAQEVAKGGGWGQKTGRRILKHEVIWITKGYIPMPYEHRSKNIASWLDDEGTILAIRKYITEVGESESF
jgi:hypothetical protein